jgi:DNA-binding SARP family transcriptional activator
MTPPLQLKLFGSPQIHYQGQPLNGLVSTKVRALLIYLAVMGRPHSRDNLAELLWGDRPDSARANLKKGLSNLRALLGGVLAEEGREAVALDRQQLWVDVVEFGQLIRQGDYQQATELYQADFLTGFELPPNEGFERWVLQEQLEYKGLMLEALRTLTYQAAQQRQLPQAIRTARRMIQLEPWHEEAHCWLMTLLAKDGQRSAVQAHFAHYQQIVTEEFGAELSTKTIALFNVLDSATEASEIDYIWDKQFPPAKPITVSNMALSNTPFIAGPPITQPQHFFGRELEVARIFGWWRTVPMGNVALIGPRRSGKSSLLRYLQAICTTPPASARPNQKRDWLPNPQRYRWVWVDFQDPRMRQQERLLCHLLRGFGLTAPSPCSLESFMDVAGSHHWNEPVIVLMDELGAGLAAPELDQSFWWALRALSQATDGNLAFAIAAHASPMRLAEDQGKTSPFFNIFTTLTLGAFTQAEALALIATAPRPFAPADVAWIVAQSQCWPFLVQICCQERLAALERRETSEQWKSAALQRIEPFAYLLTNDR